MLLFPSWKSFQQKCVHYWLTSMTFPGISLPDLTLPVSRKDPTIVIIITILSLHHHVHWRAIRHATCRKTKELFASRSFGKEVAQFLRQTLHVRIQRVWPYLLSRFALASTMLKFTVANVQSKWQQKYYITLSKIRFCFSFNSKGRNCLDKKKTRIQIFNFHLKIPYGVCWVCRVSYSWE